MAVYTYKAFNNIGTIHTGRIKAVSKEEALNLLGNRQLTPLSIHKKSKTNYGNHKNALKLNRNTVLVFTRQLLSLIKAGIPLAESLELMIEQSSDTNMRIMLKELYDQVGTGKSFSDSLQHYSNSFSGLYINSIRIAETGGNFELILNNLVAHLENEMIVRKNIRKALSYPAFLVSAILVAFIVFTTYIFPNFLPFFEKATTELPLPTKVIILIADIVNSYGLIILSALLSAGFVSYKYSKTETGRYNLHSLLLKTPVIAGFIKKISSQRFCKAIAILISQGIPLIQAMNIAVKTESNYVLRKKIVNARYKVENGEGIASALKSINIFPKVMIHMISVGEITGTLAAMMDKVSEYYQQEISHAINTITSFIEPVVTIFLAVVVMFLALSIFLPMWSMIGIAN